jgi:MFS family permease
VVARGIKGSKLFQVNVLFSAAGGLYYPAIPLFLRSINISIDETSLLLSSLSLSSFISAVIWGRVADSPQRRGRIITVTTLGGAALYMALALPLPLVAFVVILLVSSLMLSGLMPTVMAEASGWVNAIDEFSYFWIGGH